MMAMGRERTAPAGPPAQETDMSELRRIQEARAAERDDGNEEERRLKALENIADALEGIRQDLTAIASLLPERVRP